MTSAVILNEVKDLGYKDLDSSPSAQNDKELARNDKRCHPERSEGSGL